MRVVLLEQLIGYFQESLSEAFKMPKVKQQKIVKDIKQIRNLDIDSSLKDTLISSAITRHSRVANLAGVVAFDSPEVSPNSDANTINDDQLNYFKTTPKKCQLTMFNAFGKILAGEINRPGSFSKRTLSNLNDMSAEEANDFNMLCSVCVKLKLLRITMQRRYCSYI